MTEKPRYKAISVDNDNNYKEFVFNTEADLQYLPTTRFFGSFALCIATGDVYVLACPESGENGVWTKI